MAFYFPVRLNFAAKSIKVSDMDVITMESKAYKELDNKITAIADYIFNRLEAEKPNEDDMWVDSYEVCTFLKISEKTLQRLRVSGTIAYSNIRLQGQRDTPDAGRTAGKEQQGKHRQPDNQPPTIC